MINQRNPQLAYNLVSRIAPSVSLTAREGTLLARAVRENMVPLANLTGQVADLDFIETVRNAADNEAHEAVVAAAVAQGVEVINARLRLIRNDCTGDIEWVTQRVEGEVQDLLVAQPSVTVVESVMPKLYDNQTFLSLLEPFQEAPYQDIKIPDGTFPELTPAEIGQLFVTGDADLDADFADLFSLAPVSLVDLYNTYLRNKKPATYPAGTALVKPNYVYWRVLEAAALFLLGRGVVNNTIPGVNLSVQELRAIGSAFQRRYGAAANRALSERAGIVRRGTIYMANSREGNTDQVVVYQENYLSWITDGDGDGDQLSGSVEVLIGAYLKEQLAKLDRIPPSRYEEFTKAYERQAQLDNIKLMERRTAIVTASVVRSMELLLASEVDYTVLPINREDATKRMREVVAKRKFNVGDDVHYYVRHVVCKTLYDAIDAENFLKQVDKYQEDRPELTPRMCATLATRQVIVDWLWTQVNVKR